MSTVVTDTKANRGSKISERKEGTFRIADATIAVAQRSAVTIAAVLTLFI